MSPQQRAARTRALNRFEQAVREKAFEGSYPYFSDDREEQEQLDAIHFTLQDEYERAKAQLLRQLEK